MVWAPWTPITWSLLFELQNTNTSTLQIERSSVGGASRNGARLPGLEPRRAQKKNPPRRQWRVWGYFFRSWKPVSLPLNEIWRGPSYPPVAFSFNTSTLNYTGETIQGCSSELPSLASFSFWIPCWTHREPDPAFVWWWLKNWQIFPTIYSNIPYSLCCQSCQLFFLFFSCGS